MFAMGIVSVGIVLMRKIAVSIDCYLSLHSYMQ